MSATKQIRIRSKEGVVLTKTGVYKTTIDIDGYGQSDLGRSYLVLKCAFKDGDGDLIVNSTDVYLGDIASGTLYDGQCFIRNCRLSCEQFGIVEENLKINVYHQTLRRFTEGTQVEKSRQVFGNERLTTDDAGIAHVIIPLSSILGCGTQVYPNSMCGNSTLTLELEFVLDIAFQRKDELNGTSYEMLCEDITATAVGQQVKQLTTTPTFYDLETAKGWFPVGSSVNLAAIVTNPTDLFPAQQAIVESVVLDNDSHAVVNFTTNLYTFQQVGQVFSAAMNKAGGYDCNNATADDAGNIYVLTSDDADLLDVGLLTGFEYKVGYIDENNVSFYTSGVLTQYEVEAGVATMTFASPIITIDPATACTGVFITAVNNYPVSWEVQQTDLVLHKLLQEVPMKQFQYETYSVEQTNQPATLQFRKQFQLEADAMKMVYMTPLNSLISEQNLAASYRWTLNNIDLTNRNVPIDRATSGSLYYDRLLMNVDGIQQLNPSPFGDLVATIYPERCPIGQNNMAELMLDGDGLEAMEGCVGHLFKTRVKVLGGK